MSRLLSFKPFKPKHTSRFAINKIATHLHEQDIPYDEKLEMLLLNFYATYDQYIKNAKADRVVTIEDINNAEREIVDHFNSLIVKPE